MDNIYRCERVKYWLMSQFGGRYKWSTLVHNGVMFPPEYELRSVPVIYKGEEIILDKDNEEMAFLYAKYIQTDYVNNATFNRNFWKDWRRSLGKGHKIQSLADCDFNLMYNYLQENKGKNRKSKEEKETEEAKYKTVIVDGKEQQNGNFRVEPPGIFMGRGKNPNLGRIKRRIHPEDVTINIGKDAPIPALPDGQRWGKIVHDRRSVWLASWKDEIMKKTKYVFLSADSDFKAESDKNKFDLAKKLKRKIKRIREVNDKNLHSDIKEIRQVATVMYFIDKLALRVGNEKGAHEADTVGVTSLRVEHIRLNGSNEITLDFLGKDSIRYLNTVKVDTIVYTNLTEFTSNKAGGDNLFNLVSSSDVNKYLQGFMKDLTAKVFRTYNASLMFQKELRKISNRYEGKDVKRSVILDEFARANAKIAHVMNHRKGVTKGYKDKINRINEAIKKLRSKIRKVRKSKSKVKAEKIAKLEEKIKDKKTKKDMSVLMKDLALETSKANYIDPRITVAFLKRHKLEMKDVFSPKLITKFRWAFDVDTDYKF